MEFEQNSFSMIRSLSRIGILAFGLFCTVTASCVDFNKATGKDKYLSGNIIANLNPIGFQQCQKACGRRTDCLSINYDKSQLTCEMISTPFNQTTVQNKTGFVYDVKENQKTFDVCSKLQCNYTAQCFETTLETPVCSRVCTHDCLGISEAELLSHNVHNICPSDGLASVQVECIVKDGDIWTVIQKRFDGSEDFYRTWEEYKNGFGKATGEYWIGNDVLHALTAGKNYQLLVELRQDTTADVFYEEFSVGDESSNYKLSISRGYGMGGDAMEQSNGQGFSTKDRNDEDLCAVEHRSGWWHKWDDGPRCVDANLNGLYNNTSSDNSGIYWYTWFANVPLQSCLMMIKQK